MVPFTGRGTTRGVGPVTAPSRAAAGRKRPPRGRRQSHWIRESAHSSAIPAKSGRFPHRIRAEIDCNVTGTNRGGKEIDDNSARDDAARRSRRTEVSRGDRTARRRYGAPSENRGGGGAAPSWSERERPGRPAEQERGGLRRTSDD
ncbi:Hypothetical protein NTJ_04264 [Nesidiocoris tenuis]|uniref:Uncharacterized protein n=1 Tax=Nesidiocoris tenuis TaxID=355587 RepID=A0ABN7AKP1_9HEMI|nr:Hypothetical protein NTJ_04264 [Nesidiocoris tenuis]